MSKVDVSKIKLLRSEGKSLREISATLGVCKATVSKYIKDVEFPEEFVQRNKDKAKEINRGNTAYKNTKAFIERQKLHYTRIPLNTKLKSFSRGCLAESFATYILLRAGFEVFKPVSIQEACDLVVYNGTRNFRCEVKASVSDLVAVKHSSYSQQNLKYSKESRIDVVIVVQLIDELIAFIPFEVFEGRSSVKVSGVGFFSKYVNNFEVFNK